MPRPKCCCKIRRSPPHRLFCPHGEHGHESCHVVLALEELEALRLADVEGLYQEQAAMLMEVSRPTFGRLLASGRRKLAQAVVMGQTLRIEGEPSPHPVQPLTVCSSGHGVCCRNSLPAGEGLQALETRPCLTAACRGPSAGRRPCGPEPGCAQAPEKP